MQDGFFSPWLCKEEPACRVTFRMHRKHLSLSQPGAGCDAVLAGWAELWQGWHGPRATRDTGLIVTSSASCGQSTLWNRDRVSLSHRTLWWPRKFETFQGALHWYFPICRRGQIAAGTVIPGLSGSKFTHRRTSESLHPSGAQHPPLLPPEPRSFLAAGRSSTVLAAERL